MSGFAVATILAAAASAAVLVAQVMATRIDHARRLAELVSETRRLRARIRAAAPAPRQGRR